MTVSNTPPPAALEAISSGLSWVTRRTEIYEADGKTLWVPANKDTKSRLVDGSVSLDYGRDERRTLDLTLYNGDGMMEPNDNEGFWYDKIIKPYRGVKYPIIPTAPHYATSAVWETQVGEFMIDKIDSSSEDDVVKIGGRDYAKKCLNSKFEKSVSFESGTPVYLIIRALAANSGITKMQIPFSAERLESSFDVERGTERWNVMKDIANSFSYDIYFDNQGVLVMSRLPDPTLDAPVISFQIGQDGNLISISKSTDDSRLYNHVIVTGDRESVEGGEVLLPHFGEAKNTNEASPTRISKIGDRAYFFTSSFFTSSQQCQVLAESLLRIHSLESYNLNWEALVYPHLDVGRVVELNEPRSRSTFPSKYLLSTLTIPLTLSPMSATGKRVLIVG